jgi:threonine aldolase
MTSASIVDLRSDTVTRPTPAMRRAMAEAVVGDDVFGDDPTVIELERRVAALAGKEAALFVPSGTMGNQIAVRCHTRPGDEVMLERQSHIFLYEAGGLGANSGCLAHIVDSDRGALDPATLVGALRGTGDTHVAPLTLVCAENTHNRQGGRIVPLDRLQALASAARGHGVKVHLDGARLWNAAAALGVAPARLTQGVASVMVSLSKGLGCPVGSCLAFPRVQRERAWEVRKRLGGGMRQSGILAAAGLYALEHNLTRIADDHVNAKLLAERLATCPAVRPLAPETNIVMIDLVRPGDTAETVIPRLAAAGVLVVPFGTKRLRAVTHLDVTRDDIDRAASIISTTLT